MASNDQSAGHGRATHRCEDCKTDLTLLWDDRDDAETSPVCGECGGTNVHRLATDGGRETQQKSAKLPSLPWCSDCWDQAAEGTKHDLDGELPEECQHCGSNRVFWI